VAASRGNNLQAAWRDFGGNLVLGAVPKTISGFAIVFPYPFVVYQGWVGGIVSVRRDHTSRLNNPRSAVYYLLTLLLQVIPYSLAVGAGVNGGVALFRPAPCYQGEKWLGLWPKEVLRTWRASTPWRSPVPGGVAVGVPEPVERLKGILGDGNDP